MALCGPRSCGCAIQSSSLIITGSGVPGSPWVIEGASPERMTDAERLALTGGDLFDGLGVWTTDTDQLYTYTGSAWVWIGGSTISISSGFVADSGWTLNTQLASRIGNVVMLRVIATRTGGTITVTATGDISNSNVAVAPASMRGTSATTWSMVSGTTGRGAHGGYQPSTGQIVLSAVTGGSQNIVDTNQIDLCGTIIVS